LSKSSEHGWVAAMIIENEYHVSFHEVNMNPIIMHIIRPDHNHVLMRLENTWLSG
jgi:hypothetical protein